MGQLILQIIIGRNAISIWVVVLRSIIETLIYDHFNCFRDNCQEFLPEFNKNAWNGSNYDIEYGQIWNENLNFIHDAFWNTVNNFQLNSIQSDFNSNAFT